MDQERLERRLGKEEILLPEGAQVILQHTQSMFEESESRIKTEEAKKQRERKSWIKQKSRERESWRNQKNGGRKNQN